MFGDELHGVECRYLVDGLLQLLAVAPEPPLVQVQQGLRHTAHPAHYRINDLRQPTKIGKRCNACSRLAHLACRVFKLFIL